MTMLSGLFILGAQTAGELSYSELYKKVRNKEIDEEKKVAEKMKEMMPDVEEDPNESKNPLFSRELYKEERLNRVKEMRKKTEFTSAPTMDELKSKPSLKEIKMRPLVVKAQDDKLHLEKEEKDGGYM